MIEQKTQRPRRVRSHEIVEILKGWITQRSILPGERLPAERKLAADFQVSRTAIREAFLLLEENDYIEIKRGVKGGAYVKEQTVRPASRRSNILLDIDSYTLDQVAEFRQAIEKTVTAIAATKADAADIAALKHLVETVRMYVGRGWVDEFIEADKAVHVYIANIADNPLIAETLKAALSLDRYFSRFHLLEAALMEENVQDLERIVTAIEQHQPEIASSICGEHITRFNTSVM